MQTTNKEDLAYPHSIEAERAILGSILRSPDNFSLVIDKTSLTEEHFFTPINQAIFFAMKQLDEASHPIDIISVLNHLESSSNHAHEISLSYLIDLTENAPLSQNVEFYGEIVRKKFFLRKIIFACQDTISKAKHSDGELYSFVEEVEKEFLAITSANDNKAVLVHGSNILIETLEHLEQRIKAEGTITGVNSGFHELDHITGGWQPSDLIILAARPGMGKTGLALNWALNALKASPKYHVALFTLEMAKTQLMERLLSTEGRVDSTRLRKGDLNEDDQDRLMHAARIIHEFGPRLVIDETPSISITELRSRCRRFKKEFNLNLIIIDYLQLMSASTNAQKQGREREISEISVGLKSLAKELNVPVIACAQLNRGPDSRPDKRPKISDLRESGSMEQDADQIVFIYRDEYYNPNSEHAGKAELIIAKNRHGETGAIHLAWLPNYVSFHNLVPDN